MQMYRVVPITKRGNSHLGYTLVYYQTGHTYETKVYLLLKVRALDADCFI